MGIKQYLFDGSEPLKLDKMPTTSKRDKVDKEKILQRTQENLAHIALLQEKLYADGRESVILVLQAMDAAGKDSTVKHVMSGVNPAGVDVVSFKQPSSEELAHGYLWRAVKALPTRGKMGIFNRSYYEDVLVVKVHQLQKSYKMADRILQDEHFFEKRYRQILHFEEYLYENSYRVVKVFLNVSAEKQKERFLERIDDPAKNWKFSSSDLKERAHWAEYHDAYEQAINATATPESPWYVIPADQKWYARYLVSEALADALEACDPHFPVLPADALRGLAVCKELLVTDTGTPDTPALQEACRAAICAAEAAAEDAKLAENTESTGTAEAAEGAGKAKKASSKSDIAPKDANKAKKANRLSKASKSKQQ